MRAARVLLSALGGLVCWPSRSSPRARSETPLLDFGKPVERELAGGQVHDYQIQPSADYYLHAVVDQRGIDVVVTVIKPEGKKLADVDRLAYWDLRGLQKALAYANRPYRSNVFGSFSLHD